MNEQQKRKHNNNGLNTMRQFQNNKRKPSNNNIGIKPQMMDKNKQNSNFTTEHAKKNANNSQTTKTGLSVDETLKNITIKFPKSLKMVIYFPIVFVAIFGLMIFVVLFSDEDSNSISGSSVGTYIYGGSCTTISVTDTAMCDNNGNCSNTNNYNANNLPLDTYVAGVVAAKAKKDNINNTEYYKAAAIIARTNVQKNVTSNCTVKGNSDFQEYMDVTDSEYANEIKTAVAATTNIVMVKDETLIDVKSQDGSSNWKINSQEALNLINNGSKYEDVLKKYYGTDIEITNNTVILTGVNGFINPLSKIICNSAFGYREIHPVTGEKNKFHGGIDLGTNGKPAPIYAAKSGTVVSVYNHVYLENDNRKDNHGNPISDWNNGGGAGNLIQIDHGDGTSTRYLHIKYGSIPDSISIGATVTQGQQIGLTGATGRSDGVHLHYDVIVNGTKVDPADYLDLQNASRLEKCRR